MFLNQKFLEESQNGSQKGEDRSLEIPEGPPVGPDQRAIPVHGVVLELFACVAVC